MITKTQWASGKGLKMWLFQSPKNTYVCIVYRYPPYLLRSTTLSDLAVNLCHISITVSCILQWAKSKTCH